MMYKSSDGRNHQANVTIQYYESIGLIVDSYYEIMNTSVGYVSHSFNEFIDCSDGNIITVDHGDAHTRSMVLMKYEKAAGLNSFSGYVEMKSILDIDGTVGDNNTDASLGGLGVSDSAYLVVGNSKVQDGTSADTTRNIFLGGVSKHEIYIN